MCAFQREILARVCYPQRGKLPSVQRDCLGAGWTAEENPAFRFGQAERHSVLAVCSSKPLSHLAASGLRAQGSP